MLQQSDMPITGEAAAMSESTDMHPGNERPCGQFGPDPRLPHAESGGLRALGRRLCAHSDGRLFTFVGRLKFWGQIKF